MSVTYNYDEPVGGATMMQVSYYFGDQNKVIELEAVFANGVFDAEATELVVAAQANTVFDEPIIESVPMEDPPE